MGMSVNEASAVLREATRETIRKRAIWFLVQGALLVVAGLVALVAPLFASTFFIVFLGWLLIIAGIGQAIGLIGATRVHYFWLQLISAALAALVGWMLVSRPEAGLSPRCAVDGGLFHGRRHPAPGLRADDPADEELGWMVASGVTGIVLALILAANLPDAAGWLIGVLLGIELIAVGSAMAYPAWDVRRATA